MSDHRTVRDVLAAAAGETTDERAARKVAALTPEARARLVEIVATNYTATLRALGFTIIPPGGPGTVTLPADVVRALLPEYADDVPDSVRITRTSPVLSAQSDARNALAEADRGR